ncbi:MAG: protein kinase [Phycisphaerales bacterium]|nr:protein kinase [Phycisphaerales bacterium]
MSQDLHQHAEQIFSEAIDRSGAARSDYIARTCGDDPELRDEVNLLIDHYESAENVLTTPAGASHVLTSGPDDELNLTTRADGADTVIGTYRILEVLCESELGTAYLVQQERSEHPCRLDLYCAATNHGGVIRRFQVLGDQLLRLALPECATVLESGTAETGRGRQPFTVSVHCEAPVLIQHANASGLSTEGRIDLFHRVCTAVAQLHRAGIIHGDLRPETVLVQANGIPQLLDVGIARALDLPHSLTLKPDGTSSSNCTPPEAHDGACDTLGDVYALGRLGAALFCDANSATLNAICDKASANEPENRYGSADAMARDLDRCRCNQPVDAVRSGFLLECRSLASRHPASTACTVIAIIIMALLCLLLGAFSSSG